jgi:hypothetical protein
VPDEFRGWIDSLVLRFHTEFSEIEDAARAAFDAYAGDKDPANPESKKAFALYVMANHKELAGILFAMISGKEYKQIIFKAIRPRGDEEKTFKEDDS